MDVDNIKVSTIPPHKLQNELSCFENRIGFGVTMGYQIFIEKFEDGDSAVIPFEQLNQILSEYGEIKEHKQRFYFVSNVGEICEEALLSGDSKDAITGIGFDRPTAHTSLPSIVFDLLSLENTCFFGPDLEYMQSRNNMEGHLPEELEAIFPQGPSVIENASDNWPY